MIFKDLVKIKNKIKGKTAAISPSNRSERLCEQYCESEEAGQMILLSMEEKHIRPKVEGDKNNFFLPLEKDGTGWAYVVGRVTSVGQDNCP